MTQLNLPAEDTEKSELSASSATSSVVEGQCWVQCENPDCLKWRILSCEEEQNLEKDQPWFCVMNKNVLYGSCDSPEEEYMSANRIKKHGFAYRFSLLPEGSLVWAKLTGYCKWPAIVCCEPEGPHYYILDQDGDPYSYHVEFLGTRHSIAWVVQAKIDSYGSMGKEEALETCSQPLSQISMNRFRTGKKSGRRKKFHLTKQKKTSIRLAEQLQEAIDEADILLGSSEEERLKQCSYRFGTGEIAIAVEPISRLDETKQKKLKSKKGRKRKLKTDSNPPIHTHINVKIHENCMDTALSNSQQLRKQLSENKLRDFSSKEERLMADIQGLQSLEQDFLDDYARFMGRKSCHITGPRWQGVSVSLFQLYMSVQEKGGFNEVCANMRWKEIVMDCCNVISGLKCSAASSAMTYYSRNLLSYEMYVQSCKSHPSTPVVNKGKAKKKNSESSGIEKKKQKRKRKEKTRVISVNEDEEIRELEEMENLLNEFQEDSTASQDGIVLPSEIAPKDKIRLLEDEAKIIFCYNDDSQRPIKPDVVEYRKLFGNSQLDEEEPDSKDGVEIEELFDGPLVSEVPRIVTLQQVDDGTIGRCGLPDQVDSDEDLFAEIEDLDNKFEQYLYE